MFVIISRSIESGARDVCSGRRGGKAIASVESSSGCEVGGFDARATLTMAATAPLVIGGVALGGLASPTGDGRSSGL